MGSFSGSIKVPSLVTIFPLTRIWPSSIRVSALRREQRPVKAMYLWRRRFFEDEGIELFFILLVESFEVDADFEDDLGVAQVRILEIFGRDFGGGLAGD